MSEVRFTPNYSDLKKYIKVLKPEDLWNIEQMARAVDFDDCLTWLGLSASELPELDLTFAKKAHARGVVNGIHEAAGHLFTNMKTRNGAQAALEYLKAKSPDFANSEVVPTAGGKGFTFTANMHTEPEEKPKGPKLAEAS